MSLDLYQPYLFILPDVRIVSVLTTLTIDREITVHYHIIRKAWKVDLKHRLKAVTVVRTVHDVSKVTVGFINYILNGQASRCHGSGYYMEKKTRRTVHSTTNIQIHLSWRNSSNKTTDKMQLRIVCGTDKAGMRVGSPIWWTAARWYLVTEQTGA